MARAPDFIAYSADNKEVRRVTKDDPHFEDPYSRQQHHQYEEPKHDLLPPKTKAESEQHMGPEAALFYKEMHDTQ